MDDRIVGIVIEVISKKRKLNQKRNLTEKEGHITSCIILPKGQAYDTQFGLEFVIDKDVDNGKINETFFRLSWEKILEVRTLDGRVLYRNWYLCPTCRQITKFCSLDANGTPFCLYCSHKISVKENREICISPFEEIKT